jgi:dGTPase
LEVRELMLWESVMDSLGERVDCRLDDLLRTRAIRRLIGKEITDAVTATAARLAELKPRSVEDVRDLGRNVAGFSAGMLAMNRQLKDFLMAHFYRHPRIMRMAGKAQRLLTDLFHAYRQEPLQLPFDIQARIQHGPDSPERVICDYLAGMTDRYAISEYKKLFDPEARV